MDGPLVGALAVPASPYPTLSSSLPSSPQSSPLSVFSRTPSPPPLDPDLSTRYPSPSTTSQSDSTTPRKTCETTIRRRGDSPPPAKRRRVQPPRPRMTRYVDLANPTAESEEELGHLIQALHKKKKIVVIAGAGISVSAGIPDFRSSTGLFTTLRGQNGNRGSGKHLFDASVYKHDASTSSFHTMVRELAHMTQKAVPTSFHHMLASIAREGRLLRLYSQNIDCIDTALEPLNTNVPLNPKGPWPVTIQLHGGLQKMVCSKCGQLEDFDGSLFEGPEPPPCTQCAELDKVRTSIAGKRSHGIGRLRPRIVLYNEYNPDEEAIGNVSKADLRRAPDAVLVVGTSLKIPGVRRLVKELCQVTRSRRDGLTAWINVDNEPQGAEFKDCWDTVVRGSSDDIARLASLPQWDQLDEFASPSAWVVPERQVHDGKLEVVLSSSPVKKEEEQEQMARVRPLVLPPLKTKTPTASMPTPISSPKPTRKRLPEQRKTSTTQQSRLPFQVKKANGTAKPKDALEKEGASSMKGIKGVSSIGNVSTVNKAKVSKPTKPRQPKKKDVKPPPTKSIASTFRTVKNWPSATTGKRKALPLGRPSASARTSPGKPSDADSARPPLSHAKEADGHGVHTPVTSPVGHNSTLTISPLSKPHGMGQLID